MDPRVFLVLPAVATLEDVWRCKIHATRWKIHHRDLRVRAGITVPLELARETEPGQFEWVTELRTMEPGDTLFGVLVE